MAASDYRSCDNCNCKAFYDANLNYEVVKGGGAECIRDSDFKLDYLGDWTVLCIDCAKKFRCVIVPLAPIHEEES